MSSKDAVLHKVLAQDSLDSILFSSFHIPSEEHLWALRVYVGNLNQTHSQCMVSSNGSSILVEPNQYDFILLPTEAELDQHNFYTSNKSSLINFGSQGKSPHISTYVDHSKRSSMLKFQEHVDPVVAVSYCEMVDGMCATLGQKGEHKWSENFFGYVKEVSQETVNKFGERGAEMYSVIKKLDSLAVSYGASKEMNVRQGLKAQIKETHAELQHKFSKTLKTYIEKNSQKTYTKALLSPNKLLKTADKYAKNGSARPVIVKAKFDRYLKYMKYGKYLPDVAVLAGTYFTEKEFYQQYQKGEKISTKKFFVENAGLVGMIVIGSAFVSFLPLEIPILIFAAVGAAGALVGEGLFKLAAEEGYDKWLQ